MNKANDTTAAERPQDSEIVSMLKEMEYDFHALVCMANISEFLLEDMFSQKNIVHSKPGLCPHYRLTDEDVKNASFAYHDITDKAETIKRRFMERLYPKEVQS